MNRLIYVALGSNLPSPVYGEPQQVLEAALQALVRRGITIVRRSRWWRSAPVPMSDQPWFVNGVVELSTDLAPAPLLQVLHEIEADLGRVRQERWGARIVDLDLLDYQGLIADGDPALPHPRLHERAFVLGPLAEIAPAWRHPGTGESIDNLLTRLDTAQTATPIG